MNDNRTLIQSSIISLIIVILGLFMLCVGRAPKLNVDDAPLIEGGGVEADSLSDDDFMSLLESADDNVSESDDSQSTSETILFGDDTGEDANGGEEEEATDEDLAEIFQLLDIDENEASDSEQTEQSDNDELAQLLAGDNEASGGETDGEVNPEAFENLESEIGRLEKVLEEKDAQIDSIQQSIREYDEQIAKLESTENYPGGSSGNMMYASHVESEQGTATTEEQSLDNSEFSAASDYEQQYNVALNYFHNREYQLAIMAFEKLLSDNNTHNLADNCQYWIGECEFARGNYYQAVVEFEKVFSYDSADKKDDAQLMMALAYLKAGVTQQARNDFSWFLACYRSSEYYNKAERYMNQL